MTKNEIMKDSMQKHTFRRDVLLVNIGLFEHTNKNESCSVLRSSNVSFFPTFFPFVVHLYVVRFTYAYKGTRNMRLPTKRDTPTWVSMRTRSLAPAGFRSFFFKWMWDHCLCMTTKHVGVNW